MSGWRAGLIGWVGLVAAGCRAPPPPAPEPSAAEVRTALARLVDEDGFRQRCRECGERARVRHMHFPPPDDATDTSEVIASCLPPSTIGPRDGRALVACGSNESAQ